MILLYAPPAAHADPLPTVTPAAPQQTLPPDVIVLRDGGMIRGTLIEYTPGAFASIQLVTGEIRRVDASLITSAGPVRPTEPPDSGTALAQPPVGPLGPLGMLTMPMTQPPPAMGGDEVHFETNGAPLTLHLQVANTMFGWGGSSLGSRGATSFQSYRQICVAPCTTTLPTGTQMVGVSLTNRQPVLARNGMVVVPGGHYRVDYQNRRGIRVLGAVLGIAGLVGGMALTLHGALAPLRCDFGRTCPSRTGEWVSGVALFSVATIATPFLMVRRDGAMIVPIQGHF